jgi:Asp-tRNA(Asn)/Glu-tRNA(Gln) amidotransferase A subunit family amidase
MAQFMSAQGPLASEVRLGLEIMSQRDMRDPWWVPAPLERPPMTTPIKVALARVPADMVTDPEVIALVRTAADHLASAGYDVTEVDVPDLADTCSPCGTVLGTRTMWCVPSAFGGCSSVRDHRRWTSDWETSEAAFFAEHGLPSELSAQGSVSPTEAHVRSRAPA